MSEVCITIDWRPDTADETVVKFTGRYKSLCQLEKADMLKDALYALERKYNGVVKRGIIRIPAKGAKKK